MNRSIVSILLLLLVSSSLIFASGAQEEDPGALLQESGEVTKEIPETLLERFSYSFGYLSAMSFIQQGIELDVEYFAQAVAEAYGDVEPALTVEQMNAALEEYQQKMMADMRELEEESAAMNLLAAEEFLAENARRDEVRTTESGLQYEVIEEGSGAMPTVDAVVTVHYTGTLLDGSVFDSSHDHGEPVSFPLAGVIPGWTEGLQLMNVGSTFMFYLHPDLAYGSQGIPPYIGPNEVLTFEVELLDIE